MMGRDGPSRTVTVRQHWYPGPPLLTSGPPRSQGLSSSHTSARILLPVRRSKFAT